MNTKPTFWQLVCHALIIGFFTGLIAGTGFGLFFGLLFSSGGFLFSAGVVAIGPLSGILIGTGFGAVNGLIIAWLTQRYFSPPLDLSRYHRTMGWVCTLTSLLLGSGIMALRPNSAGFGLVAIPIIMVASWWASQKVCDWYSGKATSTIAIEGP